MSRDWPDPVGRATDYLRSRWSEPVSTAIILGTGAGKVAEQIVVDQAIDYGDIPHFPTSTALGHAGQLILGQLAGCPVLAMQGRFHFYEGYSLDQIAIPLRVMRQLGIGRLVVTNAAGGIHPRLRSGDVMAIESHIDLMNRTGGGHFAEGFAGRPGQRIDRYDPQMIDRAIAVGRQNDFPVHRGVYVGMLGPNYETRAEYRFLRRVGGDVVGMSTVPEVAVAAGLQMRVLALSVVTNVVDPDRLKPTSGQEVIDAAEIAEPKLSLIISDAVPSTIR